MVDYQGRRIALSLAYVAIGLRLRLAAVSNALGPPAHPREGLAAVEHVTIGCRGPGKGERGVLGHGTDPRSQPHPPRSSFRDRRQSGAASVGIEDVDDLKADLEQALSGISRAE